VHAGSGNRGAGGIVVQLGSRYGGLRVTRRGALVIDVALRQCALTGEYLRSSEPSLCGLEFALALLRRGISRLAFEFPHRDLGFGAGHSLEHLPASCGDLITFGLVSAELHKGQALSGDDEIAFLYEDILDSGGLPRGNLHLTRFDPAITVDEAVRPLRKWRVPGAAAACANACE
jgi:hypothetical protein